MEKIKKIEKFLLVFLICVSSAITLMCLVAKIPNKLIHNNMMESAKYLSEKKMYYNMIKGIDATRIDHYADSITLNIIYNLSPDKPLRSVLYSNYYGNNGKEETYNLLNVVSDNNVSANSQYIRYWHGGMVVLKPLMLLLNIEQIYVLNIILLITLVFLLSYKMIKNKLIILLISFYISLICTNSFVVPFSLEYASMYFLMLISSIILLSILEKNKFEKIYILFFIIGIFTCFFDFLTIETVTLTVPLIILLVFKYRNHKKIDIKEVILLSTKLISLWFLGYVLMWIAKWGISAIYLGENLTDVVFENASQRINKAKIHTIGLSQDNTTESVILKNIYCLFPLCFINYKLTFFIAVIFVLFTFIFLTRKEKNIQLSILLFKIGLIPYVRYILINGHSSLHYFFTYRAQFATIMAIVLGTHYIIDKKVFKFYNIIENIFKINKKKLMNNKKIVGINKKNLGSNIKKNVEINDKKNPGSNTKINVRINDEKIFESNEKNNITKSYAKYSKKITFLMPCLNEEKTLGKSIEMAKRFIKKNNIDSEILIIDNGSLDESVNIAKKLGARVEFEDKKGYGSALKSGFLKARGEYIIMGDCDTTYDFESVEDFILKLENGYDLVVGNRFNKETEINAISFIHKIGVKSLSFFAKSKYNVSINDFHCGLRGIRKKALEDIEFKTNGMEFATEMIYQFVKNNKKIVEIPIRFRKCSDIKRKPHLRTIRDGIRHLLFILKSKI